MVVKGDLLNDQELNWPNISKLFVSFLIRQIIDLNWLDLQYPCFSQKIIFKPWVNYGDGYISGHLHTVNWELNRHNMSYIPRKVAGQWRALFMSKCPKLVKYFLAGLDWTWKYHLDKNWLPTACPVKIFAYPSFFSTPLKGCMAIFTRGLCRDFCHLSGYLDQIFFWYVFDVGRCTYSN